MPTMPFLCCVHHPVEWSVEQHLHLNKKITLLKCDRHNTYFTSRGCVINFSDDDGGFETFQI